MIFPIVIFNKTQTFRKHCTNNSAVSFEQIDLQGGNDMNHLIFLYEKIEHGTVTGFCRLRDRIVNGFTALCDRCILVLFAKEGESAAEARARLHKNI